MYIYNVTVNIEAAAHNAWLEWMQTEHIPAMLATGKFNKALMARVQVEEETGGTTYSVQYTAPNRETLQKYYKENAETLHAQGNPFEGKFVAFRTELQVISEH
ncbi:MAG: DUF4286 family protein [Marinirhabdus sp.]